jgi:protein SCO1/2
MTAERHLGRPGFVRGLILAALAATTLAAGPAAVQAQHEGMDHSKHMAMAAAATGKVEEVSDLSIPDLEVETQNGDTVHFYSDLVKGRVVAMNFIFTTCQTICPPMGAIFGQLEKKLGDRMGKDVHLISISVDPSTDTPERLKQWAAKFGRTPGWTLVTGDTNKVNTILKGLQVFTPDYEDHAPLVLLGNEADGEWTRAYGLAPPAKLAEILDRLAAGQSGAAAEGSAQEEDR